MPKRKSVPSLERMSLQNVARNIWVWDPRVNHLPAIFVHRLLYLMGEEGLLTSPVLHSLLLPQLRQLDLSICPELVTEASVQAIKMRCKNLTSLNLSGCRQIPAYALIDLVTCLPHLTKLDLSKTQCNTQVLSAVGSCCPGLCELDISLCEEVTPESLVHLVYDPVSKTACCQGLQILELCTLQPTTHGQELVWALVFVLLALPRLRYLIHDSLAEAVRLIFYQRFSNVRIFPEIPSLAELARTRMLSHVNEGGSRIELALEEVSALDEYSWPVACAVCPHLEEVSVFLRDCLDLGGNLLWGSLVHLTISCKERRDLQGIWPVTRNLGARLQTLTVEGFSLEDELSFYTLLNDCQNLKDLRVAFFPPRHDGHIQVENTDASDFNLSLLPLNFPRLSSFYLRYDDMETVLPARHAHVLETSLTVLLKYSPHLESLELVCLTISLDEVFHRVLAPPEPALLQLQKLFLLEDEVSMDTIDLLMSSENQLKFLRMEGCLEINETDYNEVLQKVANENFDLNVFWR